MFSKYKETRAPGLPMPAPDEYHIVSVSPFEEDHASLESLGRNRRGMLPRWRLFTARDVASALEFLQRAHFPVVICERFLAAGSWKDLLDPLQLFRWPPPLIVTSRHADDYLWAEALNLGAYDVLAKPFDGREAMRVIELACLRSRPDRAAAARKRWRELAAAAM